ncbi:MAG: hypothetical protein V4628_05345 [Pseudomonadota bacterium]
MASSNRTNTDQITQYTHFAIEFFQHDNWFVAISLVTAFEFLA